MRDEPISPCLFHSQISYSLKQSPFSHSSYFPKSSDDHFLLVLSDESFETLNLLDKPNY